MIAYWITKSILSDVIDKEDCGGASVETFDYGSETLLSRGVPNLQFYFKVLIDVDLLACEFNPCIRICFTDCYFIVAVKLVLGVPSEKAALARARIADHYYLKHGLVGARCSSLSLHMIWIFIKWVCNINVFINSIYFGSSWILSCTLHIFIGSRRNFHSFGLLTHIWSYLTYWCMTHLSICCIFPRVRKICIMDQAIFYRIPHSRQLDLLQEP